MSRRTPHVLALAAAVCWLSSGAQAAPVTPSRLATTTAHLDLGEGDGLEVTLGLTDASGTQKLRVDVRHCDDQGCDVTRSWSGAFAGGTVDGSSAKAHLRTTLAGLPLEVVWSPQGSGTLVLGSTELSGGDNGSTVSTWHGDPADVRITYGGQSCHGTGGVGDAVRVSDSESDAAAPLRALRLPPGVLSC